MARKDSRLLKEIRQTRPFPSARQEAFLAILRTADVLRRRIAQVLEPYDVTPQQYNVLRILRGAGPAGLPTLAIGERLVEETPGMTRLLDRMEAKTLVRRERCKADRRQVLCYITAAGLKILEALDPAINHADVQLLGNFSDANLETLLAFLEEIRVAAENPAA
jgi:DNA-binding MarR family transcriptional regulator